VTRSPFDSLQSSVAGKAANAPSPARIWTGRVVYLHRDDMGRLKFLFDVVPLSGWPAATESVGGVELPAGQSAPQRGIPRVRMLQPFVSALRNTTTPATGIIAVPTVGSIVAVAPDDYGWVIIGFQSGPVVPLDGAEPRLAEVGYNPGFEEASSTLVDSSGVPWLTGIDEGDVVLGNGDARVKLTAIGAFIGSGPSCLHVYKNDGAWLYERYSQMERRAAGRMSYHKYLPGVAADFKSSFVSAPLPDAMVINTDIIDVSPHFSQTKPYVIKQTGLITQSTQGLGRKAGEVLPLPTEIANQSAAGTYSLIRETVVAPTAAPTGTAADADELKTTSRVVFDNQVGPDGSFHIRAGNISGLPGASILGAGSKLDLEVSYDATDQMFRILLTKAGGEIARFEIDGRSGAMNISSLKSITMKAPTVSIQADKELKLDSKNKLDLTSSGPTTLTAQNATLSSAGEFKAMKEVLAGLIALSTHKHLYTDNGSPSTTAPPAP